ncbi:hypothetical protein CY35_17G076900 [Sphagnum magellanicum]|nr:hypothetical protein CY35_17G076900 [Sphagnum magellanicum]
MNIANKSLWQSSCCHIKPVVFHNFFVFWVIGCRLEMNLSFVVIWVFLNYSFFFFLVRCCSDIASQQQDEIDDALKMGVLRSSGHSYLWISKSSDL